MMGYNMSRSSISVEAKLCFVGSFVLCGVQRSLVTLLIGFMEGVRQYGSKA